MNFEIGTPMKHAERYQVPRPPITASEVGFLHAGGAYRVGRTRRPRNLLTMHDRNKVNTRGSRICSVN